MDSSTEKLVILDYGSQYTQLIARCTSELGVYSVILPYNSSIEAIMKLNPRGIILSGGPSSVYAKGAPSLNKKLLDQQIPILGICYGLQLITKALKGEVQPSKNREYGLAKINMTKTSRLMPKDTHNSQVWMSHGDYVAVPPEGFIVTSRSNGIVCSIENPKKKLYGMQFHPEVTHTTLGKNILRNFLVDICKLSQSWSAELFIPEQLEKIRKTVGTSNVICALSGGVDSSVAASLVNKAVGKQQTCIFVDTGLLRAGEYEEVLSIYKHIGLQIKPVKAEKQFLAKLKGLEDPEKKRKMIGREFINIFQKEAQQIKNVKFLVQGTLYPDVIESISVNGPSATIKSHHNVGGLPKNLKLELLEPLRELFKDEVRVIGRQLGLPEQILQRQPFPGPGLAVRIIGEVNKSSISLVQQADKVIREEVEKTNLNKKLWQYFAVLLPIKSVGVMGDKRTYEKVIAIRAVESTDGMTANFARLPYKVLEKISNRIINETKGVNRVIYDVTSKPPGTIEWE